MIEKVYFNSPSFLQNFLISVYGVRVYFERFVGSIPKDYRDIEYAFSPHGQVSFKIQEKRLRELLRHCQRNVPYYKHLLADIDVELISSKNLHKYFPVLTKKDVLNNTDALVSIEKKRYPPKVKIATSGTSGTPLTIYATKESRRINYAFFNNFLESLGASYRTRSSILAGRKLCKGKCKKVDRYDYFNRTQYLSVYHISYETIEKYISALNKWKPEYIDSHPSALFEIQYLAKKKGLSIDFKPKFIVTSSETLTPTVRESVEEFFNAKIFDHYGCAEMCISAFSNGDKYYCDPSYSVIELVHKSQNLYSVIVTGLMNFGMPLIRYELGDAVHCDDSSNPYIFEGVDGRLDDIIVTPEGKFVGRLSPVFKGIPGLELAQVIQETKTDLVVNVVLRGGDRKDFDESFLVEKLKSSTSESMSVKVKYVSDIEKGSNGKFKTVINLVKEI